MIMRAKRNYSTVGPDLSIINLVDSGEGFNGRTSSHVGVKKVRELHSGTFALKLVLGKLARSRMNAMSSSSCVLDSCLGYFFARLVPLWLTGSHMILILFRLT